MCLCLEKKMTVKHHAQGVDYNSRQGQKMKHVVTLQKNSLEQMPKFEGVVVRYDKNAISALACL